MDFDIPTKYEELEYIIRISHIMLQVKVSGILKFLIILKVFSTTLYLHTLFLQKLLLTTISQFKHIKKRVKKEKLTFRKVILHNKMKEYRSLQSTETEGL